MFVNRYLRSMLNLRTKSCVVQGLYVDTCKHSCKHIITEKFLRNLHLTKNLHLALQTTYFMLKYL